MRANRAMHIFVAAGQDSAFCYPSWDGRLHYGLFSRKAVSNKRGARIKSDALLRPAPKWMAAHIREDRADIEGPVPLSVIVGPANHLVPVLRATGERQR
jgi:hypothetical protein